MIELWIICGIVAALLAVVALLMWLADKQLLPRMLRQRLPKKNAFLCFFILAAGSMAAGLVALSLYERTLSDEDWPARFVVSNEDVQIVFRSGSRVSMAGDDYDPQAIAVKLQATQDDIADRIAQLALQHSDTNSLESEIGDLVIAKLLTSKATHPRSGVGILVIPSVVMHRVNELQPGIDRDRQNKISNGLARLVYNYIQRDDNPVRVSRRGRVYLDVRQSDQSHRS